MHVGKLYRTAFRRDFPTYRLYPNLWPHRAWVTYFLMDPDPSGATGLLFDVVSDPAHVTDVSGVLVYRWEATVGPFESLVLDWQIGITDPNTYHHRWAFTDNQMAGEYVISADAFGVTNNNSYWDFDLTIPLSGLTYHATGDWAGAAPIPSWIFRARYADWTELPPGEEPH